MLEKVKQEWDKWTRLTPPNSLYDRTLIWLFISLLVIGFVMVTSAAIPVSTRLYDDPFYFAVRDGVYVVAALCACAFFVQIPSEKWERFNGWFFILSLLLLVVVLVLGKNVNGATRWIPIGPINFQPAELAKLAVICYFSSFYVRKFYEMRTKSQFFAPDDYSWAI